jgi:hypothetical protein
MDKQRPVHEIRLGRVRATFWRNEHEGRGYLNATFSRLYKDQDSRWRDSESYGPDDVLLLAKVADLAHTWMCEQNGERAKEENN